MGIAAMSISEASRLMIAGRLSSVELVRACLSRIDAVNGKINAIVTLDREAALRQAAEVDADRMTKRRAGPLLGMPFTIKDNIETAGMRTTASHPPLGTHIPTRDATVVARLKAAGAILLGKTNLPELAMDFQTDSPVFGRSNNPHDLGRTTGGSSGGAAAAVASGMSFFDVGNDLLGSVRIPAHYCGVVGYVPSAGVIPRTGMIPLRPTSESVRQLPRMGILARSVTDAGLIARIGAGLDGHDTSAFPVPESYWGDPISEADGTAAARPRHPPTLLVSPDAGGVPVSAETRAAFDTFIDALRISGASVRLLQKGEFDFSLARLTFLHLFYPAIGVSMPPVVRFLARRFGGMRFIDTSLRRYFSAEIARRDLMERLDALLADADALLCPVTSTPAFPHMKPARMNGPLPLYTGGIDVDGRTVDYGTAVVGFTLPFSTTGNPVVALPIGATSGGLPIGVQAVGRRFGDSSLLLTAIELETVAAPLLRPLSS
jgi:amidase